jgi:PAS domain S-box-containing protein
MGAFQASGPLDSFGLLADAMPQLVWVAAPDGTIEYFNQPWIAYTGVDLAEYQRRGADLGVVHPVDRASAVAAWRDEVASGSATEMEYRLKRAADGTYRWFLGRTVPMRDAEGNVVRYVGTATDIDDLVRAREGLAFVVEAGSRLSATLDVETICRTLASLAIERFADWCFVSLVQDGTIRTVAVAHKDARLLGQIERFRDRYPARPEDAIARVIAQNEPLLFERVTAEQLETAARDDEHLQLLRLLNFTSVMMVPLGTPDGGAFGALSMVSSDSGRAFGAGDLEVAAAVARRAANAIVNANAYAEERRLSERRHLFGRINQVLLEAPSLWPATEKIAAMIATGLSSGCLVLRFSDGGLRVQAAAHRDPEADAKLQILKGQRPLRPEIERELVAQLQRRETILHEDRDLEKAREAVWPYLLPAIETLVPQIAAIVPLYWGATLYGALVATHALDGTAGMDDVAALEEIAARASVTLERMEVFERERRIATTLQQASLPSIIPSCAGLQFDTVYLPAGDEAEVGGDWYDAIELEDGSAVVTVGDVTGRGIQAVAIMSKVRHAMGIVPRHERDPAKILDSAEWFLRKRYPEAVVTAFVGIISPDRTQIHFANAGHPLPLLRRNGTLIELEAAGLPLGLRHLDAPDPSRTMELQRGDLLLLYTDGLTESRRDVILGERQLREVLLSEAIGVTQRPARMAASAVLPRLVHDDVAILTVSLIDPPAWSFEADDARAASNARTRFLEFLTADGANPIAAKAELIFGELLGNVVRHAPGPVEVVYETTGRRAVLHVIDSGEAFASARGLPIDPLSELGRGLYIIERLAGTVRVEHVAGYGNHISVIIEDRPAALDRVCEA